MKQKGQKITMITAYDYAGGSAVAATDIDIILVGDSLGMVVFGLRKHFGCNHAGHVDPQLRGTRGAPGKYIICDMHI
jgi:3-methyl-2-oxobutanoate hydroxymethyltransferase